MTYNCSFVPNDGPPTNGYLLPLRGQEPGPKAPQNYIPVTMHGRLLSPLPLRHPWAQEAAHSWGKYMGHASWNAGEDVPEEEPMSNDAPEPSDDGRGKSVALILGWRAPFMCDVPGSWIADLRTDAFAHGQLYTALSRILRITTTEGHGFKTSTRHHGRPTNSPLSSRIDLTQLAFRQLYVISNPEFNTCHCQMALNLLHPKSHHHCTSDWGQEELLGSPGLIAKLGISDIKRHASFWIM
ncbi:hypothetical protein BD769DRAFT_1394128 [Suillus cothurnatus]|nr:hypothetical protein BD769DRAFT_1394128 [Suillus cothurnatus]